MGIPHHKRQRPLAWDDEEERVSSFSAEALPHRSGARAAGKYAGDRKTEKLRPDRNGKYLCVCPSDCEKTSLAIRRKL